MRFDPTRTPNMDTPHRLCRSVLDATVIWAVTILSARMATPRENDERPALRQQEVGDKPPKQVKPRFTISKETTCVKGPVDKDGFIDYATALHERLSNGVTPENNANVLLWKAMGPADLGCFPDLGSGKANRISTSSAFCQCEVFK